MLLDVHAHPPAMWRPQGAADTADVRAYVAGLARFDARAVVSPAPPRPGRAPDLADWERLHAGNAYVADLVGRYPDRLIGYCTTHPGYTTPGAGRARAAPGHAAGPVRRAQDAQPGLLRRPALRSADGVLRRPRRAGAAAHLEEGRPGGPGIGQLPQRGHARAAAQPGPAAPQGEVLRRARRGRLGVGRRRLQAGGQHLAGHGRWRGDRRLHGPGPAQPWAPAGSSSAPTSGGVPIPSQVSRIVACDLPPTPTWSACSGATRPTSSATACRPRGGSTSPHDRRRTRTPHRDPAADRRLPWASARIPLRPPARPGRAGRREQLPGRVARRGA